MHPNECLKLDFILVALAKMQILSAPFSWLRRIFKPRAITLQDDSGATSVLNRELEQILESTTYSTTRKVIRQELQSFLKLFDKYLYHSANGHSLDLTKITPPSKHQLVRYESICKAEDVNASLSKLAVLKVDISSDLVVLGGQDGGSFLDLTVQQISNLSSTYDVDIPLILLKSLDSLGSSQQPENIVTIMQSKYPKIFKDADSPYRVFRSASGGFDWCPAGNGDIYNTIMRSGMLDQLLLQGKEILFVSNLDNLGATVDPQILQHMVATETDFMLEVVEKRRGQAKSDILVSSAGQLTLLMENHVPSDRFDDFQFAQGFKHGNTGSLWINLPALKRAMEQDSMHLDVVANTTVTSDNRSIIQLGTSAESGIQCFKKALGVHVPSHRFLPVRTCSDLLLVKSNVFSLRHGRLCLNEAKVFNDLPVIKLGDRFHQASDLLERFKDIPNLVDLDHLTVVGDVHFGKGVVLRGTVIVIAQNGHQLYIPDNSIIENRLVSGSLTSTEL
ncbi:UTP-glucose-1-phosphate uridylyltransferase [Pleurotus ostreatus]|uniref:UTP--glucose-1-phosphate uridylyltransferase n=1 Tax=Pleurotus ostreatus TaxID=5322 RepID=A0A8H7DQ58_PLEOS|nr:UTP-glucose-1-phosphate uridylyltransferase [Pleurotus ostreatus]KAF7428191.1 UTP-glucose-1-phosphate uridylyltransferase [Pleurotus ostreatus]KAJ8696271.1 UTP-glucose-1-phosphate uridylyltransferase [Pleurotus ostreatus]